MSSRPLVFKFQGFAKTMKLIIYIYIEKWSTLSHGGNTRFELSTNKYRVLRSIVHYYNL